MLKALAARSLTTLTSAVFGILTARLIFGTAGVEYFAVYALITTLPSLMQFQDLGAGAALVNVIAASPDAPQDEDVTVTLTSVWRIMLVFSGVIILLNGLLLATGGWSALLGEAGRIPHADLAAFSCLALWAISIPLGIWLRVLLGLRRNHLTILIQGLLAPINYLAVWLILLAGVDARVYLSFASYFAAFAISIIGMGAALRHLPGPISTALRRLWSRTRHPGVRVMDVGWPMLAQMVSAPLSIAAQRYVLAQSSGTVEVAEYTAAGQVFLSLLGVISAAGVTLWPSYARRRAAGELNSGPYAIGLKLAAACVTVTFAIWLVRDPLFAFTTNGKVHVDETTVLAFSMMIVLQAFLYPLGMFIMDKQGIRFQVVPTITMAVGSLVLAFLITPKLGVTGPILANCICVLLAQIVPFSLYIHRNRERLWTTM